MLSFATSKMFNVKQFYLSKHHDVKLLTLIMLVSINYLQVRWLYICA